MSETKFVRTEKERNYTVLDNTFLKNVKKRLSQIRVSNIYVTLLKSFNGDYEKFLHTYFSDKHVMGDWYDINLEQIKKALGEF